MGVIYHIGYFNAANKATYVFGGLYILQSALFMYAGVIKQNLSFKLTWSLSSSTGTVFILYAMIIYPALNYYFWHAYPKMPIFGVTPCPTTIFTFGLLLWTTSRVPVYIIVIPFIWSLIGVSAAINLGIIEDYGLVVAGIVGSILISVGGRKRTNAT